MKSLLTIILTVCCLSSNAQYFWMENFDATYDGYRNHFVIDSTHADNLWQIGAPHKHIFDSGSAYSCPNVIITDTLNPYPPRDTSVFTILHYFESAAGPSMSMNFEYMLDIDSETRVKVEVSGDNGVNWINTITQDTTYGFYWGFTKPRLDTSVLSWQSFQLNMENWAYAVPGGPDSFPHYRTSDTLLFRFTFTSGNDTSSKDGWMMDNFYFENAILVGLTRPVLNNNMINVYPVPSTGPLYIYARDGANLPAAITISDIRGQEVYNCQSTSTYTYLNLSLPPGTYFIKYVTAESYAVKRVVIR